MPINHDQLFKTAQILIAAEDARQHEIKLERAKNEAHEIYRWAKWLAALGIEAEEYGTDIDGRPLIIAGGYSFALFTSREGQSIKIMNLKTHQLAYPYPKVAFGTNPSEWDQGWVEKQQFWIWQGLENLKAKAAAAPDPADERPDLLPSGEMLLNECADAYNLLTTIRETLWDTLDTDAAPLALVMRQTAEMIDTFLGPDVLEDDEPEDESLITFAGDDDIDAILDGEIDLDEEEMLDFLADDDDGNGLDPLLQFGDESGDDDDQVETPLEAFKKLVLSGDFVVLDTETTGLKANAEICQIAIIDSTGNVLLDTLVKPQRPIPSDATAIHHITNDMVKDAPSWLNVNEKVWELIHDKTVIVYNAEYDFRLIAQSEKACDPIALSDWHTIRRECAMLHFAERYGDYNDYHGNYRWQKLDKAASFYSVPVSAAHTALGDCLTTLAVIKAMAAEE